MQNNSVIENIMTRASVRSYQEKAVEKDKIVTLLKAGMAAPSAADKRPWHFVVVTDRKLLDGLAKANPNAAFAKKAPLAIVVCGDMSKTLQGGGKDFWIQDVSAASENILLAAHALGLGAVWTGTYPSPERCNHRHWLPGQPGNAKRQVGRAQRHLQQDYFYAIVNQYFVHYCRYKVVPLRLKQIIHQLMAFKEV